MQILPRVDTGRGVHHRDWPRTGATVPTRRSDLGDRAVGGFSDSRREVLGVVVGWGRVGLTRVNFSEGWI